MDRESSGRKVGNEVKEDRISGLSDSILCHILSFLPTKYAVATSILSSRWKLVWTSIANFDFDDRLCLEYSRTEDLTNDASTKFENFVNRVLVLSNSVNINKFTLTCCKLRYPACLNSWLFTAIMRNVREIQLDLYDVELPECLCTCKTLEVLSLRLIFVIKIPSSGMCFPSVKILFVELLSPKNSVTEKLFSSCPVLEELTIIAHFDCHDPVTNFLILSSTLKTLTIGINVQGSIYNRHNFMISAPNLKCLYIQDDTLLSYTVDELHPSCEVMIDIFRKGLEYFSTPNIQQFLRGVGKTKILDLSANTMMALEIILTKDWPTFPSVTLLEVDVGSSLWRLLLVLLDRFPNLEVFIFQKELREPAILEHGLYRPLCVPSCLLSNVKNIEMCKFTGEKEELDLIEYCLKNGEVLETMRVVSGKMTLQKKLKLCQKLLSLERGSKTCKIEFL